jgi:hypothetical protein
MRSLVAARHFVILLGRGDVDETLDFVEKKHGAVVEDSEGRMAAKLHTSVCKKLVYGTVEIVPKETK